MFLYITAIAFVAHVAGLMPPDAIRDETAIEKLRCMFLITFKYKLCFPSNCKSGCVLIVLVTSVKKSKFINQFQLVTTRYQKSIFIRSHFIRNVNINIYGNT